MSVTTTVSPGFLKSGSRYSPGPWTGGVPAVPLCPAHQRAIGRIRPSARRLDFRALQREVPVMDCECRASLKLTVWLGHSWESYESACPYLVQGPHSFKGNGKGWSLHRCQSRVTQTSYYTIHVYVGASSPILLLGYFILRHWVCSNKASSTFFFLFRTDAQAALDIYYLR